MNNVKYKEWILISGYGWCVTQCSWFISFLESADHSGSRVCSPEKMGEFCSRKRGRPLSPSWMSPWKYKMCHKNNDVSVSVTDHMWPLGACRDTCELYWKAGWSRDRMGSCPTTPRPRTVSRVPEHRHRHHPVIAMIIGYPTARISASCAPWAARWRPPGSRGGCSSATSRRCSAAARPGPACSPCRRGWPSPGCCQSSPCARRTAPATGGSSPATPAASPVKWSVLLI